jgi:hypothetical protein
MRSSTPPSPVASGVYTIIIAGSGIDFSSGFASAPLTMTFNGSTQLADSRLQLTSGLTFQAGSAFFNTPVNIQAFTNDFTFQLANPNGEGITFTIQNSAPTALGAPGGGLGYGRNTQTLDPGIQKSAAIKFDLFNTNGEGPNSTGLYTNGTSPWTPAKDMTASGVDLHSGDTMAVHMTYDGTTLTMTVTDGVTPKNAKAGMVPGLCKGKAHRPENLGYAGRRVLVSRKWSGKTLADHRADRKAWLLDTLGLPDPATAPGRYKWDHVTPADPDHMPPTRRLLHVLADRTSQQAALDQARRRAAEATGDPPATGRAA